MRRFYENWPDLKKLIPKLNIRNDDDMIFKKLLQVLNSIEKNAVGQFEMIREILNAGLTVIPLTYREYRIPDTIKKYSFKN